MSLPFCNNAKKDDMVMHHATKRVGRIAHDPDETDREVGVIWNGNKRLRHVDVMELRLIVNGRPEDVPPVDGTPAAVARPRPVAVTGTDALATLKQERDEIDEQMRSLEVMFKGLREKKSRIDRAITALTTPSE